MLGIVSAVIVIFFVICYREIPLVFNDPEQTQWLCITANGIRNVLLFLTGISIGISMKVVGALLIDAIVLLPAMATVQLSSGFGQTLWLSSLLGIITTTGGFARSLTIDLPTGATIRMTGVIVFGAALAWCIFL
ncbi:metal ABC transporter permease [Brevibacillus centrosporus]|uniref:metal ABC transporter permease n=1 Tax=Brevibacillus centrosporus TaxID=54910 RepID=UPI003985F399